MERSFFTLVPPDHWIIANYKESQTGHMTVGRTGLVLALMPLAGLVFKGQGRSPFARRRIRIFGAQTRQCDREFP